MEFTAAQIAEMIGGDVEGNPDVKVSDLSKIESGQEGTLSFLANPKYAQYIYDTDASVVIVNKDFELEKEVKSTCTLVRVEDAYQSFAKLLEYYNNVRIHDGGISDQAFVDENAKVGNDVYVGAFSCISEGAEIADGVKIYPQVFIGKNVKIGKGTVLFPGVKIMDHCIVGAQCMIQSGAVIGSDGFGFAQQQEGAYNKVPQIGNVILEDHVDIGANTTIDRATLGSTIIRKGVKLDNLIQVAHNVEIGENTAAAAQVGIAGSAKLGKNMMIGGQVGISGHIEIADGVMIAAQSGIPNNIRKEGVKLLGSPAIELDDFKKSYFGFRKLPYILKKLRALEEELEDLKAKKE